jgi:hypothetical protein
MTVSADVSHRGFGSASFSDDRHEGGRGGVFFTVQRSARVGPVSPSTGPGRTPRCPRGPRPGLRGSAPRAAPAGGDPRVGAVSRSNRCHDNDCGGWAQVIPQGVALGWCSRRGAEAPVTALPDRRRRNVTVSACRTTQGSPRRPQQASAVLPRCPERQCARPRLAPALPKTLSARQWHWLLRVDADTQYR